VIKINFQEKTLRKSRRAVFIIAFAAITAVLFAYLKKVGILGADPAFQKQNGIVHKQVSPPEKTATVHKRKSSGKKDFKVAGFVRFGDRDFAMLISKGRTLWVEEGQSAFGFKIENIEEEGVVAEVGPAADEKVFFPLRK